MRISDLNVSTKKLTILVLSSLKNYFNLFRQTSWVEPIDCESGGSQPDFYLPSNNKLID